MRTRLAVILLAALPLATPAAAQDPQARALIGAALTSSAARTLAVDGYTLTGTGIGGRMVVEVRKFPGAPGSFPRWGSRVAESHLGTDGEGTVRGALRFWLGIETLLDRGRNRAGPIGKDTVHGRRAYVISFSDVRDLEDGPRAATPISARVWLDSATLVPLRISNHGDLPGDAVAAPATVTLTLSDYRPAGRLLIPHRMVFVHGGAVPAIPAAEIPGLRAHLQRLRARAAAATGAARDPLLPQILVTEAMVTGKPPEVVIEVSSVAVSPRTR
ncbi:MAG TPA: hypothetical protein VEX86_28675 [Longimicrobium sp.]|nr:hypothetical protein [Longimicrobium sp.]